MRKLIVKDIVPFTKILSKMELKEPLNQFLSGIETEKNNKERGIEILSALVCIVIDNYAKADKEFIAFMADLNGTTVKEIENMEIGAFFNLIKELFSSSNISFFKSAAK